MKPSWAVARCFRLSMENYCSSKKFFPITGQKRVINVRLNDEVIRFSSSSNLKSNSSPNENEKYPPNSSITPTFVNNRNPKNLEKLRIGDKPAGYILERESKCFWNKITLEISAKHISASVIHFSGQRPINVSSKEWCLKKYLYSTNDASSAKLVGQVLAQRCLQAGITEVACFFPEAHREKEKVKLFLKAVEDGGISLTEPPQIPPDYNIHTWSLPETPWEIHEGVDDDVLSVCKLPNTTVRSSKYIHWKKMLNEFKK